MTGLLTPLRIAVPFWGLLKLWVVCPPSGVRYWKGYNRKSSKCSPLFLQKKNLLVYLGLEIRHRVALSFQVFAIRGAILNKTYGTRKPLYFAIFANNIWSYLLWSTTIEWFAFRYWVIYHSVPEQNKMFYINVQRERFLIFGTECMALLKDPQYCWELGGGYSGR